MASRLACKADVLSTKSEQVLANKFKLSLRDLVGCTGGTGNTSSTGDEDNKLPGVFPRLVFNRSSGTSIGEGGTRLSTSMAGHRLVAHAVGHRICTVVPSLQLDGASQLVSALSFLQTCWVLAVFKTAKNRNKSGQ